MTPNALEASPMSFCACHSAQAWFCPCFANLGDSLHLKMEATFLLCGFVITLISEWLLQATALSMLLGKP